MTGGNRSFSTSPKEEEPFPALPRARKCSGVLDPTGTPSGVSGADMPLRCHPGSEGKSLLPWSNSLGTIAGQSY